MFIYAFKSIYCIGICGTFILSISFRSISVQTPFPSCCGVDTYKINDDIRKLTTEAICSHLLCEKTNANTHPLEWICCARFVALKHIQFQLFILLVKLCCCRFIFFYSTVTWRQTQLTVKLSGWCYKLKMVLFHELWHTIITLESPHFWLNSTSSLTFYWSKVHLNSESLVRPAIQCNILVECESN